MDVAIQLVSIDKTKRSKHNTRYIGFKKMSVNTNRKKGKELVSMTPSFKEAFNLSGVVVVENSNCDGVS